MARRNPQVTFRDDDDLALVYTEISGAPAFILVDPLREGYFVEGGDVSEAVVGFMSLHRPHVEEDGFRIYPVDQSVSVKGYGPILYEAAMAWATTKHDGQAGVMPGSQVSKPARRVWERFDNRKDYRAEELSGELGKHGDEVLDQWFAPNQPLPGFEHALQNGADFVADFASKHGYWGEEADTLIFEAGHSMFDVAMAKARETPESAIFSRRE